MDETSDQAAAYGDEGGLDLRTAARWLDQAHRDAKRELDFRSPWLTLLAAAVVLVGFGTMWLSVRGQHPFTGPSAASLVMVYALVAIRLGTVAYAASQARAGLSGRTLRKWRAEAAALAAALLGHTALQVWLLRASRPQA